MLRRLPPSVSVPCPREASDCVRYARSELIRLLEGAGVLCTEESALLVILMDDGASGLVGGAFRRTVTETEILLEASEGCGIVYGMYDLLEDMGWRFLAPDCETEPEQPMMPETGTIQETPAFRARELFWRGAMDGAFAVKLRLNSARSTITPEQGGKLMFYNFSHSFNALVSAEQWFDSHPEYFSMRNGVRIKEKTQLCLSNPQVLKLCTEGVRRWIRENPDCRIFSVSMNDWYNPCECPACRAVDEAEGSQAGSVIRFVNAIAEEIGKDHPDVLLHTFAYLYCRKPPRHVRPAKNVIVRLCSIECCFSHPISECGRERGGIDVQNGSAANFAASSPSASSAFIGDLKEWASICDNLFVWDYTTNYANYLLPFPNFRALQANLQLFYHSGVKGVFEQGNFSHGQCSALGQLKTYLLGKLLWNPYRDADKLIREFVEGYYGAAAEPMMRYVGLWQDAAGEHHAGIYDMPDAAYLTDTLLAEAQSCLAQALALCEGTPAYERVEREALSVRYALLAREDPEAAGHSKAADAFAEDVYRLGITELFERKALAPSLELLKTNRYTRDRTGVSAISYPI